jgi:hypothetical protein
VVANTDEVGGPGDVEHQAVPAEPDVASGQLGDPASSEPHGLRVQAKRRYRGSSPANAFITVLREIPNRRVLTAIAMPSANRSRRISAQSCTVSTF